MSKNFKIIDKTGTVQAEIICEKLSILSEFNFLNEQNYFQYYNNGFHGIINYNGIFLLDPIYEESIFLINVKNEISYFKVKKGGLIGIVDSNGKTVLPIKYSEIFQQDDVYRIKLNELYGFLDSNFNVIIEPVYSKTGVFSSNLCYVKNQLFNGFINKKGDKILDVSSFSFCEKFYGQLASYNSLIENLGMQKGFINIKGNVVVEPKYSMVYDFQENLIVVGKRGGFLNLLDQDGTEILEDVYSSDITISFNEKLAKVKKKSKYGFIDINGIEVIKCKYSGLERFTCGISVFKEKKLFGCINKTGEIVVSPKYDKIGGFSNTISMENSNSYNTAYDSLIKSAYMNQEYSNSDARAVASIGTSVGFIDTIGNEVVPLIYDDIDYSPKEGVYKVKKRNVFGYVDIFGKEIVAPQYNFARNFSNDLAAVKTNDKWGFVNKNGTEIIKCIYSGSTNFIGQGFAIVEL
jgi:hypothetical protein